LVKKGGGVFSGKGGPKQLSVKITTMKGGDIVWCRNGPGLYTEKKWQEDNY